MHNDKTREFASISVFIKYCKIMSSAFIDLGPVVQRLISTNPGLNLNPGFYISLFKSHFGIILPNVFRAFNYKIVVKKI